MMLVCFKLDKIMHCKYNYKIITIRKIFYMLERLTNFGRNIKIISEVKNYDFNVCKTC